MSVGTTSGVKRQRCSIRGVRWEHLTSHQHEDVDFLHVIYDVGGSSSGDERLMRHPGREDGYVLSGVLGVQLGFEQHELGPGDLIGFDSTVPPLLWNKGEEPMSARSRSPARGPR